MPAKADKEKQKLFLVERLEPLIEQALENKIKLFFMDGVHLTYGAELGYSWSIEPVIVKSAYGRKRFNVLGAYDLKTSKTEFISNDTYLNAESVALLFKQIRENNAEKEIHMVLDNAKYQKCQLVEDAAKEYNIILEYLPSYSPNLNLIERLWKWLRKKCLCNKYRETFKEFCSDILETLSQTGTTFIDTVQKWLTPNFIILGD